MTSWRDSASQRAQDELDTLLGSALEFAEQQLAAGDLAPVAFAMDVHGQLLLVGADPEALPESATATEIRAQLYAQLIAGMESLRATAVAVDVTVPSGDAVRVELEHSEGLAITVIAPVPTQRRADHVR